MRSHSWYAAELEAQPKEFGSTICSLVWTEVVKRAARKEDKIVERIENVLIHVIWYFEDWRGFIKSYCYGVILLQTNVRYYKV